jgi:hypothetical protein
MLCIESANEGLQFEDCPLVTKMIWYLQLWGARGGTVVKALRYKPEGRGFDSRWCYWIFFIDIILLATLWPWGVDSASNRNEYQEYFLGVKAAGA